MSCLRFGSGVAHRKSVLPQHNAIAEKFLCSALKCTLTSAACAARFVLAETLTYSERWQASCCRGCAIGRGNQAVGR